MMLRYYPDPALSTVCDSSETEKLSDEDLLKLTEDMLKTMYEHGGVGLSANQVGINARVIVMDVSKARTRPMRMVNPELTKVDGELIRMQEGCLSFPGVYVDHKRAKTCTVRYFDPLDKQTKEFDCHGITAVCIQHEMDHLNGLTMLDKISQLKKNRALKQLQKKKL